MTRTEKTYVVMIEEEFYHYCEDILDVIGTGFEHDVKTRRFDSMEEAIKWIREDVTDYIRDKFITTYDVENLNETEIQGKITSVRRIVRIGYDSMVYDKQLCYRTYSVYISERKVGLGGRPLSKSIGRR